MSKQQHIRFKQLVEDIDAFLEKHPHGEKYFGRVSTGNQELLPRLRAGGRCMPETEDAVRAYMESYDGQPS